MTNINKQPDIKFRVLGALSSEEQQTNSDIGNL